MSDGILGGHAAAQVLRASGVPWVTGVSGESFLPLLDGLRAQGLPFRSVVQEAGATFLASAHARITGHAAIAAVTRGPGASNALIGIHEAAQAGAPLVLIVGQLDSSIRGRKALQEMEFTQVFASVAKAVIEVSRPEQLASSLLAAIRKAELGRPGPVVVSVPTDHFYATVPEPTDALPQGPLEASSALGPESARELADLIQGARRGLFIVGETFAGGRHAAALARIAETAGFGVIGGHSVPDALPAGHALWLGSSTIRGTPALKETLRDADTIVLVGHWLGDRVTQGYLPLSAKIAVMSRTIEVGWDEYLGAKFHPADPLVGLAQLEATVDAAAPQRQERLAWVAERKRRHSTHDEEIMARSRSDAPRDAVTFGTIVDVLDAALPAGATIVSDAGSFNDWFMRYLPFGDRRRYVGTISGSMGFAIPGAMGVQLALPGSRVVALVGDGGFLMTGMELATLARLRLPVTVIVFRNRIWGSIAIHQDRNFPGQRFAVDLPDVSPAAIGRALGVAAEVVTTGAAVGKALRTAFASAEPHLIEIATDAARPSPSSYEPSEAVDRLR